MWKGELVEDNFNRRKVCLKAIRVTVRGGGKERKENEKVGELLSFGDGPFTQFMVFRRSMRRSPSGCG